MEFRIADTFLASLARLNAAEQKAVKQTAFDLQTDPAAPGLRLHRLERSRDPDFWSVRVGGDIRIILHRSGSGTLLCYADHHDEAYRWAERRRIERHPKTGAAQLVELPQIAGAAAPEAPTAVAATALQPARRKGPALFAALDDAALLSLGVPPDWLAPVRAVDEEELLDLATHLPGEAAEALLNLAVGAKPELPAAPATPAPAHPAPADAFAHPDAQRRFRVMANREELEAALEAPWERWAVFLHPSQRALVERDYGGPARVVGSAGTGKTIVALHRAVWLARHQPAARVLLTTFSRSLAHALTTRLAILVGHDAALAARIRVAALGAYAHDLFTAAHGQPNMASAALVQSLLDKAAKAVAGHGFNRRFLLAEWTEVVDAWQVTGWEQYRDVPRLGRRTRLGQKQREQLWSIFALVRAGLAERKAMTWADLFGRLTADLAAGGPPPVDFAVVDEAQDLAVPEARFLAALGGGRRNGLFFTGDLGQRIFQQPFSWKGLGLDVRGRSYTLRINYRTSHQIRAQADRLLPASVSDVDGITADRRGTVSVFSGPPPEVRTFPDAEAEQEAVGTWLAERLAAGVPAEELAVFVRSEAQLKRARQAARRAGRPCVELGEKVEVTPGAIAIAVMHLAKGLEFRAVAVMACDDEVIPLQERIESVTDEADLEEVYTTERHLLYVACTRAREHLLVTGVEPESEFLGDLLPHR